MDKHSSPVSSEEAQFLIFDPDPQVRASRVRELERADVEARDIVAVGDPSEALRSVRAQRSRRVVAIVGGPLDAAGRALLAGLRAGSAYVIAMVPRGQWVSAVSAHRDGADDVLLTPCAPQTFAVRAFLAREAVRNARPAPWHRPRAVLQEALAHPTGGEVIVRSATSNTRILVTNGRVAWVHDDGAQDALIDRLRAFGARVTADELAQVVAECQRTREHFAEVLARWGLAERDAVMNAVRALVDSRLKSVLTKRNAAAMFLPARWASASQVGFTSDELRIGSATMPPPELDVSVEPPSSVRPELRARCEQLAQEVLAIQGCVSAMVLDHRASEVVSVAGEGEHVSLAWTLGAALDALEEPRADVLASTATRCHLARRLPSDPECFVYAAFDVEATPLALARLGLASAVETAR